MYNTTNTITGPRGLSGINDAVEVIWKRVNRNSGADCAATNTCYSREVVERVMNAYISALTTDKLFSYYSPGMRDKVCPIVAPLAQVPVNQVCAILNELFEATQAGYLDSTEYLLPVKTASDVRNPDKVSTVEATPQMPSKIKYTLIGIGLVGAGILTGVMFTKAGK